MLLKNEIFFVVITVLFMLSFLFVSGEPSPPLTLTVGESFRANFSTTGSSIGAQAGNVTNLIISGTSVTETWQGYYGQISGGLTLQNSDNKTLYRWSVFSSNGEVYASNTSTVNWSSIKCVNLTGDSQLEINLTTLDTMFNINNSGGDGFNQTFNEIYNESFFIGNNLINRSDYCPKTNMYNESGAQSTFFNEVLMTDTSSRGIIFVGIAEDDARGFNNLTQDYEMIVADDGHKGDTAVTPYYFFVEML